MKIVDELLNKDWLEQKYIQEGLTYSQIGKLVNRSKHAVFRAVKRLGIKARKHSSRFPQLNDKQWLKTQYIDNQLTLREIADLLGTTVGNIHSALTHADIPTRDYKEGLKVKYKEGRFGKLASNWKGGKIMTGGGHVYIYSPNHPLANHKGYVMEHRLVMEKHIGRFLTQEEVVHHLDGSKINNELENLKLLPNRQEHLKLHFEAIKENAYLKKLLKD